SSSFRIYAEIAGNIDASQPGSIQTGVAIANSKATPVMVTFELINVDGSSTGLTGSVTVPANGQVATFLNTVPGLQNVATPFRGLLRISGSDISVLGLRGRYNQRGEFLTASTLPVDESAPPPVGEYEFPHLVDGGGFTTQIILFSGAPGQA